tara:strand:- start:789 stop:1061 length:273 start_codon:yes stop_codon:yes gene_type:complete
MKQIKNLTVNRAKEYIFFNYGYLKHDIKNLVKTSRELAKKYNCTPFDMFFLAIENRPISKLFTHSYGFNTRQGREIIKEFKYIYNLKLNK